MRSPSVSLVLVFVLVVSVGGGLFGCEGTPDTPDTGTANTPNANFQALAPLTVADVQTIIAQAVTQAVAQQCAGDHRRRRPGGQCPWSLSDDQCSADDTHWEFFIAALC